MTQQQVIYAFHDTVTEVEQRTRRRHVGGINANSEFRDESLGWFVSLAITHLSIRVGSTQPDLKSGDQIKVMLVKTI